MRSMLRKWLGIEMRSALPEYDARYSPDVWGRAVSPAGYASSARVASVSAVAHRAKHLKAQTLASLSVHGYKRLPDGARERLPPEHPVERLLAAPNRHQTAFEFLEMIGHGLDNDGNFVAEIAFGRNGAPSALNPLPWSAISMDRTASGMVRYRVSEPSGLTRTLLEHEVLHVRNATGPDGLIGLPPAKTARAALELALALSDVSYETALNGNRIGGYLIQDTKKNAKQAKQQEDYTDDRVRGPRNIGSLRLLDADAKFVPNHFDNESSELLDSRVFSAEETARIYDVPGQLIGLTGSNSYASAQQAFLDFVVLTLQPRAVRIESALERTLLSENERGTTFIAFSLDTLLRADPAQRWVTNEIMRRTGAVSGNDLRRMENLGPPVDGGDDYGPPSGRVSAAPPAASAAP